MWPPKTLRARLSDRFKLLSRPASSGPRRQATLQGALDWSWELLQPWEQSALAQCSVFRGGFGWEAAEAVVDLVNWPEAPWVVDVVARLVEQSLVMVGEGPGGESRLSLLVSVGAYAADKLVEMGEAEVLAAERRHARHYAAFGTVEYLESLGLHGGIQRRVQLHSEVTNLVVAANRGIRSDWIDEARQVCLAALKVWQSTGPFALGVQLAERVYALAAAPTTWCRFLGEWGVLFQQMGKLNEARERFNQALAIACEEGNSRLLSLNVIT